MIKKMLLNKLEIIMIDTFIDILDIIKQASFEIGVERE